MNHVPGHWPSRSSSISFSLSSVRYVKGKYLTGAGARSWSLPPSFPGLGEWSRLPPDKLRSSGLTPLSSPDLPCPRKAWSHARRHQNLWTINGEFLFALSVVFLVAYTLFIRVSLHSSLLKTPFLLTDLQGQAFFVLLLPVIAFTIVCLVKARGICS